MKNLARWLFARFWSDEIIEAHKYIKQRNLQASRSEGVRKNYPMREAYGAMDALAIVGLFNKRDAE